MKTNSILRLLSLALLFFVGCQEEYITDIDQMDRVLVVDGLLTNTPGPHKVSLTLAGRFQDDYFPSPVLGARVSISDQTGAKVSLYETGNGDYLTPQNFYGKPGNTYVLEVEIPDGLLAGNSYRSAPQTIMPPVNIDSVYGVYGQEVFYKYSNVTGRIFQTKAEGAHVYLKTSPDHEQPANFRFVSVMYVQYFIPISDVTVDFCWLKMAVNDYLRTEIGRYAHLEGSIERMGFSPFYSTNIPYLGFPQNPYYEKARAFINKLYTLNDDSYAFHKNKSEQLTNEGRFFDPIASQLPGNMRCLNDSNVKVLGLFEASSELVVTYNVVTDFWEKNVIIEFIHPLDHVPVTGCLRNNHPEHWVF